MATQAVIKQYSELFGTHWARRMHKSNVRVPCIYGLPKIHKPGNQYRPIVANYDSPIANIASWLCQKFSQLKGYDHFSVKNSLELIEKLKTQTVRPGERIVSFDIKSFFTNVPKKGALDALRNWLSKQNINPLEQAALWNLTKVCLDQSYFQFRGEFYRQKDGLAMGLCLSPFLCNLFMITVEEKLKQNPLFPRFYHRYVDDIVAIVEDCKVDETLNLMNSACPDIQFTCESDKNNQLPFLDLIIQHSNDGTIGVHSATSLRRSMR